jgi:hypothetical protein
VKKLKEIPKFKSLSQERRFWATHDSTEYIDYASGDVGIFPKLKTSSITISIQLPQSLIEALQLLAKRQDILFQSMLTKLLAEKVWKTLNLQTKGGRLISKRR